MTRGSYRRLFDLLGRRALVTGAAGILGGRFAEGLADSGAAVACLDLEEGPCQALARRLESAEEMPQVHYAHLYQKLKPEIGAAVEPICGGHMIFAGLNSPIGRTVGMGFDGSASAERGVVAPAFTGIGP